MSSPNVNAPEARGDHWLDADTLKSVSVRRVLDEYGLLEGVSERGSTLSGPSPFKGSGTLSINLAKNVWNDSAGRPEIEGRTVPGNVIGLVQAIERVPFRRALEILSERFGGQRADDGARTRAKAEATLRAEGVTAKAEGNTPFGKELKGLKADVPFLQNAGIGPELAKARGVGWCSRGLLRGRIAFPIRSASGTVIAYAGMSPKTDEPELWKFPTGFHRSLELFGIEKVHQDETVRDRAHELGIVLVEDPFQALRLEASQAGAQAIVSPMGPELGEAQLAMLLDPAINPTGRLTLMAGEVPRRLWAKVLIRRAWIRYADPPEPAS